MWTETKVISAMGLHATATKRKYDLGPVTEDNDTYMNCSPHKASRWSSETSTTNNSNSNTIQTTPPSSTDDSIAKLEVVAAVPCEPWSTEPIVDSISKLQAVTVPGDTWGGVSTTRSTLATALLSSDEFDDDDDDFEDEFEEDESIIPTYCPLRYPPCTPPQRNYMHQGGYSKPNFYSEPFPQQNCSRTANQQQHQQQQQQQQQHQQQQQQQHQQQQHPMRITNFSWNNNHHHHHHHNGNYYMSQHETNTYSQQTIRCAENGKSYLELGSSSFNNGMDTRHSKGCCDGRGTWCNSKSCYKEIRLKIRNLSMFKLSRFRQVSEQSLYRSVLICNTLKQIDKEMESEGKDPTLNSHNFLPTQQQINARLSMESNESMNQGFQQHQQQQQQQQHQPQPQQQHHQQQQQHQQHHQQSQYSNNSHSNDNNRDFTPTFNQINARIPTLTYNNSLCSNDSLHPYDHHPFRDSQSGRATPFPAQTHTDTDSGYGGDDDGNRSINWSSVLSLSSQSALDPLNNNDLFSTLPATSIPSIQSSSTPTTTTNVSGTFSTQSFTNTAQVLSSITTPTWEYDFLDMDLGIRPEFTELLPSCKMSSDDLFKSVSPSMNTSRYVHENELEAPAHIMVGS